MTTQNPPAFPAAMWNGEDVAELPGMTLRDYFAAKAMGRGYAEILASRTPATEQVKLQIANSAYEMADAMLKARQA